MRLRVLCAVLLANLMAVSAHAGTVTGSIQRPNGQPLANGVVTFSLSQAGVTQAGSITVTSDNVYCGTSSTGTVVGVADPAASAVLSANYGAGTLPATQYFVEFTYTSASGESFTSPETTFLMTSNGTLNGNAPLLQPGNATGYKVYIGTSSGGETLQQTIVGFAGWSQSATLGAGAAPPVSNSTLCNTLIFNDAITPSYTTYLVNLLDSKGKQVSGYPQRYYFSGTTLDLSTLAPAANLYARFPNAIVAQPGGNGLQSIAGPLSLGTNSFFAGTLNGSALNVTTAGVFTNTQANLYVQSIINGCNQASEFNLQQGAGFTTDGITACMSVPGSSTARQANGIASYVTNASGTTTPVVAVYGQARCLGTVDGRCFGGNFLVASTVGTASTNLIAVESDINAMNAGDAGENILINGTVSSANIQGLLIAKPGGSIAKWANGIYFQNGSSAIGIHFLLGATPAAVGGAGAILFEPVAAGNSQDSQGFSLNSTDSGGTSNTATFIEKANGNLSIATSKANSGLVVNGTPVTVTVATGTATVDLASVASGACTADSADVTLTGASVGDPARVVAATALPAGVWLIGRVTASNTGRFQLCNLSGGAVDRASDTYTISVVK